VKSIAEQLSVNASWIYRICGQSEHDPYSRFLDLHWAVSEVNPAGADLYATDFLARHEANKHGELIKGANWDTVLSEAMILTQQALAEAVTRGADTEAKVNTAIRALRQLLTQHKADPKQG
jgi:hypothetical protein